MSKDNKTMKQNTLLALTDNERGVYKNMVDDHSKLFANKQGAFRGERRTYSAKEGTVDDASKRGFTSVQTTVGEKLDWFVEHSRDFIKHMFTQERTNAMCNKTVELIVDGVSFGNLTSLELLRLKNLLEAKDLGHLNTMITSLPTRSDTEQWHVCVDPTFDGREIFQTEIVSTLVKTTEKSQYILPDPNLERLKDHSSYRPVTAETTVVKELGDSTYQKFSGEITHLERARMLDRHTRLLNAVIAALKDVNDVEVAESPLTADAIFGYIFGK